MTGSAARGADGLVVAVRRRADRGEAEAAVDAPCDLRFGIGDFPGARARGREGERARRRAGAQQTALGWMRVRAGTLGSEAILGGDLDADAIHDMIMVSASETAVSTEAA